ncbi:MAG: hypothetical protein RPU51_09155 [Candidatus Sedimenticola sp. (ex Thyasira tokunagai)]
MIDWQVVLTITLACLGLLFGLYRWIVHRTDKRHASHDKKFEEHGHRFNRHETRIEKNEAMVVQTRDEVHREYVHTKQMERLMDGLNDSIKEVHTRIGGMSKDLNQAIGTIKAGSDAEMKALVSEIKNALKPNE